MLVSVGIALGSNQGDRTSELDRAVAFLRNLAADGAVAESARYETAPVDCPPGSESFLNGVVEVELDPENWPPERLLGTLQQFETERGRTLQHELNSPRPIDLDILYYGSLRLNTPKLTIPHPRLTKRRFVLEPLASLRANLILPGQSQSVQELLASTSDIALPH